MAEMDPDLRRDGNVLHRKLLAQKVATSLHLIAQRR